MMAGADEPATLSGLCQPMAMAMVTVFCSQSRASGVATPFRVEADGGTSEDSTMAVAGTALRGGVTSES